MKKKFLVRCPHCGNKQQMIVYSGRPKNHKKKCVYCNRSFDIHPNINRSRIVKEIE